MSSTAEKVNQKVYMVQKEDKKKTINLFTTRGKITNVLVFVRTKHSADNVVKALKKNEITAEAIHGDKSQSARLRVLDEFKTKQIGYS